MIYQIKTKRSASTMRQAQVEVRERPTGELTIEYKQRPLAYTIYQKQEQQQGKVIEAKLLQPCAARAAARPQQKRGPVPTRWRRFSFSKNSLQAKTLREISARLVEEFKNNRLNTPTKKKTPRRPAPSIVS
ncbi:MAG TPA: hypothetical protein VFR78_16340 [Pyrinomonadaceae bacterium]|nr:hypothetical protein [Pyrinomonadaceae bacterium]